MENNSKNDLVEEVIIENLSFYEWISIEKFLIGLSQSDLVLVEDLTMDELKTILDSLHSRKIVDKKVEKKEAFYKRIHAKKSLTSKIKSFLK